MTWKGLQGFSSQVREAKRHTLRTSCWKTFNQLALIVVILYGLQENWLGPKFLSEATPFWFYLGAPVLGAVVLFAGNWILIPWVRFHQKAFPAEYQRNAAQ